MTVENLKNVILAEAYKNEDVYIVYVDGALTAFFDDFAKQFPNKFINVGIAEAEAISIASGLALRGKTVYVVGLAQYVTARAYEQVRMDCAYNNANVKIIGFISGLSSCKAGYSHWAIEDINLMSNLPNMTVCCPGSDVEFREVFKYSLKHKGPMYISWNTAKCAMKKYSVDVNKISTIYDGCDFAMLTYGADVSFGIDFCENMIKAGLSPMLLSVHTLKPLDVSKINEILDMNIPIITLEEHLYNGSLASRVSEIIATRGLKVPFMPIYIGDSEFNILGSVKFLRDRLFNVKDIENSIVDFVQKNKTKNKKYRLVYSIHKFDKKGRLVENVYFCGLKLLKKRKKINKDKYKYYLFGFLPVN